MRIETFQRRVFVMMSFVLRFHLTRERRGTPRWVIRDTAANNLRNNRNRYYSLKG
ncbi:MAG: hypothetical protein KAI83_15505 [Thiomargarita sp.]|nr:hypothetical protein [Thiomargarita sp.]